MTLLKENNVIAGAADTSRVGSRLLSLFERLTTIPTAPFREQWVMTELHTILRELGLEPVLDAWGNTIVRTPGRLPDSGPLPVYVAHLDHPGFMLPLDGAQPYDAAKPNQYEIRFEGVVLRNPYFQDARVRLYRSADDIGVPARIIKSLRNETAAEFETFLVETEANADGAMLAMWDLPPFAYDEMTDLVHARVCDDLAGAATIVEALARVVDGASDGVACAAIFSRAEEAGFCGVLALFEDGPWPAHVLPPPDECLFVSVESSSEQPSAEVGGGPIIRLGDKASTFDGRWIDTFVAIAAEEQLVARRALMPAGTCEATVFAMRGFPTAAVSIPLKNYHNMDKMREVLAPEAIALKDAERLAALLSRLPSHVGTRGESAGLRKRMGHFLAKARTEL